LEFEIEPLDAGEHERGQLDRRSFARSKEFADLFDGSER